jgi:hypothetical protein
LGWLLVNIPRDQPVYLCTVLVLAKFSDSGLLVAGLAGDR